MALKETLLTKSLTSHALDEDELVQLVNQSVTNLDDSSSLPTAGVEYLGQSYIIKGVHYVCELVETVPTWVTYDTSGQSLHYPDASGKPTLDGITINGVLTKAALGIAADSTTRTQAASLEVTDKIPINDDEYATIDELGNKIASEYSTEREFTDDYPFLYFQSDLSMSIINTPSTSELVLTDEAYNSIEWSFSPTQSGIIKNTDEINVQFSTTGLVNATYNAIIELYINTIKIAEKTTIFGNSQSISPQLHKNILSNIVGDKQYTTSDSIKVKLTLNKVGGSGASTIYIYNSSTRSSYLNIRKYIGQSEDTTETNTSDTITLYNNEKNTLRFIQNTHTVSLTISISHYTSNLKGIEIYGTEHEVIIYNGSGGSVATYVSSKAALPSAISVSIDNGKCLYFKYKIINENSTTLVLLTNIQSNILIG